MSESSTGDSSRPGDHDRLRQLSHAPGSPRRQVQFGDVCCVQIGSASSIHVRVGRADWILSLAAAFTLNVQDKSESLDPTGCSRLRHLEVSPLLCLIGARAHAPEWDRTGHVVIEFTGTVSIGCAPDPLVSAWTITGPHGQTWTCRPGGQVVRERRSLNGYAPPGVCTPHNDRCRP